MNAAEFEAALCSDGFGEIGTRDLPGGTCKAEHEHPFDVRALVLSGEITLTVEGIERAYREGSVFVMPAGRAHQESVGPAGVRYIFDRRHAT